MKRKNSQENQLAILQKQVQFLQDELEGKTMELSSKTELVKTFADREKEALEKKEKFNQEALQFKQENYEILQVMEGMKREKKDLVQIFDTKKKAYEEQIAELNKYIQSQSKRLSKVAGKLDLEDDMVQLHSTIKAKEEVVQIMNEEQNLLKSDILRLQKQLKELKDDNVELYQQNFHFKEDCDQKINQLRENHFKECSNYQTEIDKLIDRIRELSYANKQLENSSYQALQQSLQVQQFQHDSNQENSQENSQENNQENKKEIEEIIQLKQQLEDQNLEKDILTNKYNNELKCLKENQKNLLAEKENYQRKCEESEKQIKQLQVKCDQQIALLKMRQVQSQPSTSNSHIDSSTIKKEKKILEALSARVQDLTEENANLKQSLQDSSAISNTYESKLKQKSQSILNIIQEIKNTYPEMTDPSLQKIQQMDKDVIQSFKGYTVDDLFSLVEDLFTENMRTKKQIREMLIQQSKLKQQQQQ